MKTQVENGLSKLSNFLGQTIDMSDQAVFTLKDSGLHDEEGNKINTSNPLTAAQRRPGPFLSFMMMVHSDQADPNCKHIRMTFRSCVQLPLDVYGIESSINIQMLKTPHNLLVHLSALDNERKPDICTIKKDKGDIFPDCCTESFKEKFLRYINEVLF